LQGATQYPWFPCEPSFHEGPGKNPIYYLERMAKKNPIFIFERMAKKNI
jgi:hypothetical protein